MMIELWFFFPMSLADRSSFADSDGIELRVELRIQTRCCDTPRSPTACQNDSQLTRSKAFERSRLMIHNGWSFSTVLSKITTDMCRWPRNFDILIRLSLQWFVLLQGTGRFSKMISTMLMWYSENCFEAWSAQLLPQTGHDLGMKSCMTGMHGLHNLFNNIRWKVGPCVAWKCIGTWRDMLPAYLRTVGCPAFWCGRAGDIRVLIVLETLGTLRYRTFAGISIWATGGRGEGCEPVGKSDATVRIPLHRIMNKTIWRALMCT